MTNDATYSGVKLGFIGVGNMGGALARAARKSVPGNCIGLAGRTPERVKALAEELDCRASGGVGVAKWADYIFLGVKPQMMPKLLEELKPVLAERQEDRKSVV